jgi:Flp pilus assembly protein TadD
MPRLAPLLCLAAYLICAGQLGAQESAPASSAGEDTTPGNLTAEQTPEIPVTARAAIEEGNAAFERGDFDAARGAYEVARKVVPRNTLVLVNLGLVEFKRGRRDEAERFLFEALQNDLRLARAWQTLGLMYLDNQQYEKAMAAFAQAVLHEPRNARSRNYLGVSIGQLGWYDGAESEFRKAIELDPRYADAHFNLAYFYLQRPNPAIELARRHYHRALEFGAERDLQIEQKLRGKPSTTPTPSSGAS